MGLTKTQRQEVYDKCGGRCAYCGCELEKGWHVDHVQSIRRKYKTIRGYHRHKQSGAVVKKLPANWRATIEYVRGKTVPNGCMNPELDCVDNMLPACASCNINKHGDTLEVFRASIAGYLRSLNLRMVQYKVVKRYGLVEETGKEVVFYFEQLNQRLS
jgi:hypothetical protein